MNTPKYSIIIPVYNAEKYLRFCVDSILSQVVDNFELLLVNDGSKDDSGRICDEYAKKDNRIKAIHQDNMGASFARNVGIENANGEWISFVDADDWVAPDYLEIMDKVDEKADINFFSIVCVYADDNRIARLPKPFYITNRVEMEMQIFKMRYGLVGDYFGYTVCKFVRAELIKEHQIRFNADLVFREDEIFTLQLIKYAKSIRMLEKPLYFYRYVENGLTAKGIRRNDRLILACSLQENLKSFSNHEMILADIKRIVDYHIDDALFSVSLRHPFIGFLKLEKFFESNSSFRCSNIHPFIIHHFGDNYLKSLASFYLYYFYKKAKGYLK